MQILKLINNIINYKLKKKLIMNIKKYTKFFFNFNKKK